jgi:hypothetical protein
MSSSLNARDRPHSGLFLGMSPTIGDEPCPLPKGEDPARPLLHCLVDSSFRHPEVAAQSDELLNVLVGIVPGVQLCSLVRSRGLARFGLVQFASPRGVMAPQALWSGNLRLSLVLIPVRLYPAVLTEGSISFRIIHEPSGEPIKYVKG